jgi:hypothetical protein
MDSPNSQSASEQAVSGHTAVKSNQPLERTPPRCALRRRSTAR